MARRFAHVGEKGQTALGGEAQPRAASFEVAPAQDRGAARLGCPPAEASGGALEEFVAVGRDDERKAPVVVDRQCYQAHGTKTSVWRGPARNGVSTAASAAISASICGVTPASRASSAWGSNA